MTIQYPYGQNPYPQQAPQPPPMAAPPAPPKKPKRFGWPTVLITGAVSFLLPFFLIPSGNPDVVASPAPTVTETQLVTLPPVTAKPNDQATATAKPTTQAPATKAPKPKPKITKSQEQAIGAAQDYLDYSAFSRKGLIEQLSSDAGEGFPKADAIFAVDHIKVNWNEQAAKSAKEYLAYSHFSRKGLIEQLESDAGEGFTHSQAVYGVKKAGL